MVGKVFVTSVSLATAGALLATVPATAKPHRRARTAPALRSQASEIAELKAQVAALTARLDAQAATQQQLQAQTAQAQSTAQAVAADTSAVQNQVTAQAQAIPDQVKIALSSQPKPKPQWFDNTSISGRMYFNASIIDRKSNGVKTEGDGGFAIKRFYLGIDHKFDDIFSANLTTDVDTVIGSTAGSIVGRGLYIKKAYLQAKLNPAFIVRAGSADLPWVPFAENVYGYRHIENTLIDRTKFGTSADWGVHVLGDLADGLVSYQVSVVDGGGYRDPHFTKTVDVEARVSAQYKGLVAAVGGYTGKLGRDVQGATTFHQAERLDALVGYVQPKFTLGAEYYYAKNWTQVASLTEDSADGYSLFASYKPLPKVSVFGRYDWVKPRKDTINAFKDQYFNVGLQYSPAKIVDLALVYKREKAQNGILSTSNGNIGGTFDGTYDEIGIFGQFRF